MHICTHLLVPNKTCAAKQEERISRRFLLSVPNCSSDENLFGFRMLTRLRPYAFNASARWIQEAVAKSLPSKETMLGIEWQLESLVSIRIHDFTRFSGAKFLQKKHGTLFHANDTRC
jgi:hypothetical protein